MTKPFDILSCPIKPGTTLIEAGAGTGKTYTITNIVARLLLGGHASDVQRILVMTFTNAATAELKTRIRARLAEALRVAERDQIQNVKNAEGGGRDLDPSESDADPTLVALIRRCNDDAVSVLSNAIIRLDEMAVFTIHSFCKQMLELSAFEGGMPFEPDWTEDNRLDQERAIQDFFRRYLLQEDRRVLAAAAHEKIAIEEIQKQFSGVLNREDATFVPQTPSLDEARDNLLTCFDQANRPELIDELRAYIEARELKAPSASKVARMLQPSELESTLAAVRSPDSKRKLEQLIKLNSNEFLKAFKKPKSIPPSTPTLCEHVDTLEIACATYATALRRSAAEEARSQLRRSNEKQRRFSFSDQIHKLRDALRNGDGTSSTTELAQSIARRYDAVLIDEFQDTDSAQLDVIESCFADTKLFLIGDPKQAIYEFRGANVRTYLRAKSPAQQIFTLTHNWRSSAEQVEATNRIFEATDKPFRIDGIPFEPAIAARKETSRPTRSGEDKACQWRWLDLETTVSIASEEVAGQTAADIARLIQQSRRDSESSIKISEIAVLTRTNPQAAAIQLALSRIGIPSTRQGKGHLYEQRGFNDFLLILAAIADPSDTGAVRAALGTRAWGLRVSELQQLDENADGWEEVTGKLPAYRRRSIESGPQAAFEELAADLEFKARLVRETEGGRYLADLEHSAELAQTLFVSDGLSIGTVLREMQRLSETTHAEQYPLRREASGDAVQVTTFHGAKGLEWDFVFCPFLWTLSESDNDNGLTVFHDGDGKPVIDFGSEEIATNKQKTLDESKAAIVRLAYVALTRARERTYIYWGPLGGRKKHSVLDALLDMDPSDTDTRRERLENFVAAHDKVMELQDVKTPDFTVSPTQKLELDSKGAGGPRPRQLDSESRSRLTPLSIASFSSLAHDGGESGPRVESERSIGRQDKAEHRAFSFARGPRAGTCLHELFEQPALLAPDSTNTDDTVRKVLAKHGFQKPTNHDDGIDPIDTATEIVRNTWTAEAADLGFSMADVNANDVRREWQFYMPLAATSAGRIVEMVAGSELPDSLAGYRHAARRIDPRMVSGFLTGFVDVLFTIHGKWYLIDWKSNYLGPRIADYSQSRIGESMVEHHYPLQYHLYAVATHRLLRNRLPYYNYDEHFGGALYAYVRPIAASTNQNARGWFHHKPTLETIEKLDAELERGSTDV